MLFSEYKIQAAETETKNWHNYSDEKQITRKSQSPYAEPKVNRPKSNYNR